MQWTSSCGTRLPNYSGPGRHDWRRHTGAGTAGVAAATSCGSAATRAWRAAKSPGGPRHAVVDDQRGRGLLAQAARHGEDARRAGEDLRAAARLPHGARRRRARRDQSRRSIEFDGNGRMYVAEFITYMRDADGNGQHAPNSRITRLESTKGDGVYDKRTVFVDKLVLPRMVLPLDGNSILTNETDSDDVVKYTDTNGDGVADKREQFYTGIGIGRDGNLEHEQAGFVWGLDNWIYTHLQRVPLPLDADRHPQRADRPERRPVGPDDGRRREDVVRGRGRRARPDELPVPDPLRRVHACARPVRAGLRRSSGRRSGLGDMQGGMVRVRMPVGTARITSPRRPAPTSCAAHRVPADLRGDLLFTEPVGRLIRRARDRQDRRADAAAQRVSGIRVHAEHRSAVPAGQHHDRAGRHDLHRGHVSRHHPGSRTGRARARTCARKIEQYQLDKVDRPRPHLAAALRRRRRACRRRPPVRPRRRRRRFRRSRRSRSTPRGRACSTRRRRSSSRT